jgi:hypothetical protein
MTKEQIYEKYGNVKLKFSSYYKYSFGFAGITEDGERVYASIGGDSDEVYRLDVDADTEETLKTLEPNIIRISKGKKTIADWSEW